MAQSPDTLLLKIGAPVGLPATGHKVLFADTDGSVKTLDATGTKAAVGGGGAIVPWFSTVAQFIQTLQPTLLVSTLATECTALSVELEAPAASGTGAATVVTTETGGVLQSASGATANSFQYIRNRGGVGAPVVSNSRTNKYAIANKVKIVQTQATFIFDLCGLTDEATNATSISAIQTVSGVNYVLKVGSDTGQNTGTAFSVGTWVTLCMIADGTNIKAYLGAADGSGLAQIGSAQAQSTSPNASGAWLFNAQNLATAASVSSRVDCGLVLTERA